MENENPHRPEEPIIIPERIDKPSYEWPAGPITIGEAVKTVFTQPLDCLHIIAERKDPKKLKLEWQFLGGTFVLSWLLAIVFILINAYEDIGEEFFAILAIAFLLAIICLGYLFFISLLTFILKAIKGKTKFTDELLTSGLASIPLGITLVYLSIFVTADDFYS